MRARFGILTLRAFIPEFEYNLWQGLGMEDWRSRQTSSRCEILDAPAGCLP